MFGRTVGVVAALSLGASAFLLPPGVQNTDAPGASALALDAKSQALKLPCSSCVFPSKEEKITETEEGDDLFWAQGGANDLILNFTVSEDDHSVMLNGWQLYPLTMGNTEHPTLSQVSSSKSLADVVEHPEQMTSLDVSGASITIDEEVASPAGKKIVSLVYHVLAIESQPMTLDGAKLTLLETADGSLMIISVEPVDKSQDMFELAPPPPPSSGHRGPGPHGKHGEHGSKKECSMLPAALCKLKHMIEFEIAGFRQGPPRKFGGCPGRKGSKGKGLPSHIKGPHFEKTGETDEKRPMGGEQPPMDGERPHHRPHGAHGPHGQHRGPHHRHHHSFWHRLPRAFLLVFIPIMAGITTGMFVCLIGMAVGRLISFLWIKLFRGGKRGYANVAQVDADELIMEKGAIVVVEDEEEEESLPQYEHAPAYETEERK